MSSDLDSSYERSDRKRQADSPIISPGSYVQPSSLRLHREGSVDSHHKVKIEVSLCTGMEGGSGVGVQCTFLHG